MNPTILLLQARHPDDPAAADERRSFADKAGLPLENMVTHDLLEGPPAAHLNGADAIMVGGAGDFYVSKRNLPHFDRYMDYLRELVTRDVPVFASCFGFQSLVQALDGEIVFDPDNTEVGTYEVTLTATGREDPLFANLPSRFAAQLGRKDRAERLPQLADVLASSAVCAQALRIPGKSIWATQFHPELDGDENLRRFEIYLQGYAGALEMDPDEVRRRFGPSPEASTLIRRFLEVVFAL